MDPCFTEAFCFLFEFKQSFHFLQSHPGAKELQLQNIPWFSHNLFLRSHGFLNFVSEHLHTFKAELTTMTFQHSMQKTLNLVTLFLLTVAHFQVLRSILCSISLTTNLQYGEENICLPQNCCWRQQRFSLTCIWYDFLLRTIKRRIKKSL